MQNRQLKILGLFLWGCLILTALYFAQDNDIALNTIPGQLKEWVESLGVWGPVCFIFIYILRPFLFFPPSILCAGSGLIFGPWLGMLFTILGENLSAQITYQLGKIFASKLVIHLTREQGISARIFSILREHDLLAVLILRLTYLPFDLVGYVCGATRVGPMNFILGTFLGTLPGIVGFVFLGSSVSDSGNLIIVLVSILIGVALFKIFQQNPYKPQKSLS